MQACGTHFVVENGTLGTSRANGGGAIGHSPANYHECSQSRNKGAAKIDCDNWWETFARLWPTSQIDSVETVLLLNDNNSHTQCIQKVVCDNTMGLCAANSAHSQPIFRYIFHCVLLSATAAPTTSTISKQNSSIPFAIWRESVQLG